MYINKEKFNGIRQQLNQANNAYLNKIAKFCAGKAGKQHPELNGMIHPTLLLRAVEFKPAHFYYSIGDNNTVYIADCIGETTAVRSEYATKNLSTISKYCGGNGILNNTTTWTRMDVPSKSTLTFACTARVLGVLLSSDPTSFKTRMSYIGHVPVRLVAYYAPNFDMISPGYQQILYAPLMSTTSLVTKNACLSHGGVTEAFDFNPQLCTESLLGYFILTEPGLGTALGVVPLEYFMQVADMTQYRNFFPFVSTVENLHISLTTAQFSYDASARATSINGKPLTTTQAKKDTASKWLPSIDFKPTQSDLLALGKTKTPKVTAEAPVGTPVTARKSYNDLLRGLLKLDFNPVETAQVDNTKNIDLEYKDDKNLHMILKMSAEGPTEVLYTYSGVLLKRENLSNAKEATAEKLYDTCMKARLISKPASKANTASKVN